MNFFSNFKKPAFETDEALSVFQKCTEMMEILAGYEAIVYKVCVCAQLPLFLLVDLSCLCSRL